MADSVVGRLIYKITGDVSDISKSLKNTQKQIQNFTRFVQSAAGLFGTVAAFRLLTNVGKDLIREYTAQEQAESLLRASLRDTGENVDNLLLRYKAFASQIQRVTTVGDEQVLSLLQQAKSYGIASDKMEEATRGAIGLNKAFGIDTQTALRGIANAYEGNFTALSRYIPALRSAVTEADKMAVLQKAMAEGFDLAKAAAKTGTGQLEQLKLAIGDLKETGGKALLDFLTPSIAALKDFVSGITASLESSKAYRDFVKGLTEGSEAAAAAQKHAEEQLAKYRAELQKLNLALREESQMIAGTMDMRGRDAMEVFNSFETHKMMKQEVLRLIAAWERETKAIKENKEELQANEEAERKRIAAAKAHAEILARQALMYQALAGNIASMENRATTLVEETDAVAAGIQLMADRWVMAGVVFGTIAEQNAAALEDVEKLRQEYQDLATTLITTIAPVFQALGTMIVEGADAWDVFKDAAKNAIAAIIEAFARQWLLQSIASFIPGPTFNPLAGAGYAALYLTAQVAKGIVQALGEGGVVTEPTLALVGEKGPEAVVPLDRMPAQFPERIIVRIGSRDFNAYLEDEFDAGRIRVNARTVVR